MNELFDILSYVNTHYYHTGATTGGIPVYWMIIGGSMLLSWLVSARMKSRFTEFSRIPLPITGREVAEQMLRSNGIHDVQVISTPGHLTDHYNPTNKTVNLSDSVYNSNSVAAAAVAAHECGHAIQHAHSYHWLGLRSKLVPVVSIASNLVQWVLLIGIILLASGGTPWVLGVGCILFGMTTLFAFVTLPVEFNASARALEWLDRSHLMNYMDHGKAKSALFWAAMTYVVGALSSLAMLLYYVFMFLNARNRD